MPSRCLLGWRPSASRPALITPPSSTTSRGSSETFFSSSATNPSSLTGVRLSHGCCSRSSPIQVSISSFLFLSSLFPWIKDVIFNSSHLLQLSIELLPGRLPCPSPPTVFSVYSSTRSEPFSPQSTTSPTTCLNCFVLKGMPSWNLLRKSSMLFQRPPMTTPLLQSQLSSWSAIPRQSKNSAIPSAISTPSARLLVEIELLPSYSFITIYILAY